jgi:exopolyphosphatase/guanosine-5'-triphosphate,3'-diphosphate pyrophosphatase
MKSLSVVKKEKELILTVGSDDDYTLERGIFRENVDFFEEIFDLRPILKMKKKR